MVTVYIYDEKLKIIARPIVNSYEEFIANPSGTYQAWNPDNHIADIQEFKNAIIVDGELRDKKREESILLDNKLELLQPGEYVEDGKIVFVGCPEDIYKPQWVSPNWVEGATLEEVKKYKRGQLQSERDFRIVAPYEYNTVIYQADLNSQDKFFKAMQLGKGKEQPTEWIALDNSTHLLTNNDLINIVNGISERELESFNNFNAIYATVAACESVEEVKSIFWY